MSADSETIASIAARQRKEAILASAEAQSQAERHAKDVDAVLRKLADALGCLQMPTEAGLRIHVESKGITPGLVSRLRVSIARLPQWLAFPIVVCDVTAWHVGDEVRIFLSVSHPSIDTAFGKALAEARDDGADQDKVIAAFKRIAAESINASGSVSYTLPHWYSFVGRKLGWLLALAVYLSSVAMGGWTGVLLGWIPAAVAYVFARWLWVPAAIGLIAWARTLG